MFAMRKEYVKYNITPTEFTELRWIFTDARTNCAHLAACSCNVAIRAIANQNNIIATHPSTTWTDCQSMVQSKKCFRWNLSNITSKYKAQHSSIFKMFYVCVHTPVCLPFCGSGVLAFASVFSLPACQLWSSSPSGVCTLNGWGERWPLLSIKGSID